MNYNPLIGVFSTVKINPDTGFPVGKEARTFKEKFAAAKKYGLTMFLFLADDVSLMNRTINGYVFTTGNDNKSYWERKVFPFPDIVYNRIRFRKVEKQSDVRQLLKTFADDPHIKLFNSRFLDKWEVHQALIKNLTTQDMVPPTYLLSIPNLRTLLAKYTRVFIKPRNNNAGRGIIKVICDSPSM